MLLHNRWSHCLKNSTSVYLTVSLLFKGKEKYSWISFSLTICCVGLLHSCQIAFFLKFIFVWVTRWENELRVIWISFYLLKFTVCQMMYSKIEPLKGIQTSTKTNEPHSTLECDGILRLSMLIKKGCYHHSACWYFPIAVFSLLARSLTKLFDDTLC